MKGCVNYPYVLISKLSDGLSAISPNLPVTQQTISFLATTTSMHLNTIISDPISTGLELGSMSFYPAFIRINDSMGLGRRLRCG